MTTQIRPTADEIRDVTEEEIAAFHRDGWIKVPQLLSPGLAAAILDRAKAIMGKDVGEYQKSELAKDVWRKYEEPSEEDSFLKSISHAAQIGRVASRLLRDRPIRFMDDEFLIKMPSARFEAGPTAWHQDFPHTARDRSEQLMVWIALDDVPAERGSLRFVTGSHRYGSLGRVLQEPTNDLLAQYPEIFEECELAPPIDLKAGDATIHHSLMIHSAPPNTTDEIRWAYTLALFNANALYTGASQRLIDKLGGFEVNQPFEHPRMPVIWPPADRPVE